MGPIHMFAPADEAPTVEATQFQAGVVEPEPIKKTNEQEMESNNSSASAPNIGEEVQLSSVVATPETEGLVKTTPSAAPVVPTHSDAGASTNDYVFPLIKALGEEAKVSYTPTVSYQAVKDKFRFAYAAGNRLISNAQLTRLWNDVKDSVDKTFDRPIECIPLKEILAVDPEFKAHDCKTGELVTLESGDIDSYLVPSDGQHRLTVALLHSEVDMKIELHNYNDFGNNYYEHVKKANANQRKWNKDDHTRSNVVTGKTDGAFFSNVEEVKSIAPLSTKAAEYLLTYKREPTRLADAVAGKEVEFNQETADRGIALLKAWVATFGVDKEAKTTYRMELVDALKSIYDNLSDKQHPNYGRNLKCAIALMTENNKTEVKELFKVKDWAKLNKFLRTIYTDFVKANKGKDVEAISVEVDETITESLKVKQEEAAKDIKRLKAGTIAEIYSNHKALSKAESDAK